MQAFRTSGGHRLGGDGGGGYGRAPGDMMPDVMPESCGEAQHSVLLCGCLLGVLGLGALAVTSLGSVPPLHYGIRYNHFSKSTDTATVYDPGRYLIGPFNKFLLFPSTVQNFEFANEPHIRVSGIRYEPLHTRTKEGLGLHLQVSLQYRLKRESLGNLYNEFNQNYEQVFTSSIRDVLIKAASEYEATQLWEERQAFGDKLQKMVSKELERTYAECWGLQLMIIDLPDDYENSIVRTQVQKQSLLMREQEQQSAKIRAETTVIQAEYSRKVKVIMAEGHANYTLLTKKAQAEAQQNKIGVESEVLGHLKSKLNLGVDGLVRYQKYGAMDDLGEASLFYGFSGPSSMMIRASGA
mmetsp:Transcript_30010/g.75706  ORF Transcript_30010/g.75706 Transcript_30010/m.75706 type:complete len:353 (-) Transcript_30010:304-1362(-)